MSELEIFVALLTTMLAIVAILGGAIYKIILKIVEKKVMSLARAQLHIAVATSYLLDSLNCWRDYEKTKACAMLDHAIESLRDIYSSHIAHLDDKKRENELLICWFKNDFAYYLAERGKLGNALPGDDALAKQCAKYCYDRIHKYPENGATWEETYLFVKSNFP